MRYLKFAAAAAVIFLAVCMCFFSPGEAAASDQREQAHGMNYVTDPVSGYSYLIWSDEYDSGTMDNGNWTHDIFYQQIDPNGPKLGKKKVLVSAYEAQEPASASFSSDGNLLVTFEDGNDTHGYTVAQRYAIFRPGSSGSLVPVKDYSPDDTVIGLGGHSGHCSSTADRHVVAWSEGWTDGGGDKGLGTGNNVFVSAMRTDGTGVVTKSIAAGSRTRDWWPLTASSVKKDRSIIVWQRYVKKHTYSRLMYAVYDPQTNKVLSRARVGDYKVKYYNYSVTYLESIDRYVLTATLKSGKGIMMLITPAGKITVKKSGLAAFVREAEPAAGTSDGGKTVTVCYPRAAGGGVYYRITKSGIAKLRTSPGDKWGYRGTSGFFGSDTEQASFVTLGADSVELRTLQ
jgi:hypothetical protein